MGLLDRIGPAASGQCSGYILLPVTLCISLIATLALLLNMETGSDASEAGSELQASQVQYLAEAGFAHAQWHARNNVCSGTAALSSSSFDNGSYATQLSAQASAVNHYSLPVAADTFIDKVLPDQLHGGWTEVLIENSGSIERRGLLRFDLSAVPQSLQVVQAVAWFYISRSGSANPLSIHAITAPWTEADANWTRMTGSMDPVPYASLHAQTAGSWVAVNLTALAQTWVNAPHANHGLLIVSPQASGDSRFGAREADPALRPRLDIIVADGAVSPLQVTTTAVLAGRPGAANDVGRLQRQSSFTAYQAPVEFTLQPDSTAGKDTSLTDWKPTWNFGAVQDLEVNYGGGGGRSGSASRSLLQFALGIPAEAIIERAELNLYQTAYSGHGGVANVLRVENAWEEGTGTGGNTPGSGWLNRDRFRAWDRPGGDLSAQIFATAAVASGPRWISWDITELLQGWVDGSYPNYGLAVVPGSSHTAVVFASSDISTAAQRPRLTVRYRCECGSPCRSGAPAP